MARKVTLERIEKGMEARTEDRRAFLIQTSGKLARHFTVTFDDRTYNDEVAKHLYYRHEDWDQKKRDQGFGDARVGDYVLQYCTGDVESNPSQIKSIYEIVGLEKVEENIDAALKSGVIDKEKANEMRKRPHLMRLKLHRQLKQGFELSLIRSWVSEGRLSKGMNNCGLLGFNMCQVAIADYEALLQWDTNQPTPPPPSLISHLEEDLRRHIAALPSLGLVGRSYRTYHLFSGDAGKTGELYDTGAVGIIDLLYQSKEGDYAVVELKRTEDTSDKAVGQIARYMGWVQENLAGGKRVRGLLVVRSASEELRYAVKAMKNCRLATYEVAFNFKVVK